MVCNQILLYVCFQHSEAVQHYQQKTQPLYLHRYSGLFFSEAKNLQITYNHLNLPSKFTFSATKFIEILYDAAGQKLRKKTTDGTAITTQDYLGGIELKNNRLESIYNEEGRAYNTTNATQTYPYTWRREYNLKDHLGNTRVSFTDKNANGIIDNQTELLQETHYYPFGMSFNGAWYSDATASKNKYLYNGKELNDEFGLNLSDYGARWYDASIGRWWSVDPLAEKYNFITPYNQSLNNPIKFLDPNGKEPMDPIRRNFYVILGDLVGKQVSQRFGEENRYKSLYILAQIRTEAGFNLKESGKNNILGLKRAGDEGSKSVVTHEDYGKGKVKITDKFGSFSSKAACIDGYIENINNMQPKAYTALSDKNATIKDFAKGLVDGGYATDKDYEKSLMANFKTTKDDVISLEKEKVNSLEEMKESIGKQPLMLSGLGAILYQASSERFEDMQSKMAIDGQIQRIKVEIEKIKKQE